MSDKTEKRLDSLENDVIIMEQKYKEFAEKLRKKKEQTEETRNLAIVEIVRERNVSISELKAVLSSGSGNLLDSISAIQVAPTTEKSTLRKESKHEEID